MKWFLEWIERMWWKILIVVVLVLAYFVGMPKDMAILEWVKGVVK